MSQTLPEKEARAIASQICAGLAYINSPPHRIIHYDLKPANVLFNQHGEVKLTVSMSYKYSQALHMTPAK